VKFLVELFLSAASIKTLLKLQAAIHHLKCCPSSPPSKYAAKRKKRCAYTRTSAACCAVHATLACAWLTLSLFSFGDESYRPPRPSARKLSAAFLFVRL
jgi:hypothetical protein